MASAPAVDGEGVVGGSSIKVGVACLMGVSTDVGLTVTVGVAVEIGVPVPPAMAAKGPVAPGPGPVEGLGTPATAGV